MRTVVGGTRRAAPPQVQPRLDLRHYFALTNEKHRGRGDTCSPAPGAAPPRSAGCSRVLLNRAAEELSQAALPGEWRLHPQMVLLIWRCFGLAQVDLFASLDSSGCLIET